MPPRSKIQGLPDDVRQWLDDALAEGGFQGYELLEQMLAERGFSIGKSTIGRYGQKLQRKLDAIKASSQAAQMIAKQTGDDEDSMSRAVVSIVQSQLFEVLVDLQELDEEGVNLEARAVMLTKVSRGIADLSRSSMALKKWEIELRNKAEAAAQKVAKIVKNTGLSKEDADAIRREILGIGA
jgi:hypothetical protein